MSDEQLRDRFVRDLVRPMGAARQDCPDPEALLAVAEDRASEHERLDVMGHVAGCLPCQRDLALLGQVSEARPSPARLAPTWLAAAAAIVVISLVGVLWLQSPADPVFRGDGSEVLLVSPTGDVALEEAPAFLWRTVPGATRYELEIIDPSGNVVADATVPDTVAAMPVGVTEAGLYRWRVTAVRRDGTRTASGFGRFTLIRR